MTPPDADRFPLDPHAVERAAAALHLAPATLTPYGPGVRKVVPVPPGPLADVAAARSPDGVPGRLVLVSALTPTKAGEGKTTVSVGLADGLARLGRRAVAALREPSLGPVFGIKGGGTGGGRAQIEPAERINLHFTGDLHAIAAAHDLLAALVDNDLHWAALDAAKGRPAPASAGDGPAPTGASGLTPATATWGRVLDVDDRALRSVTLAAGGRAERASRFDITAASEIMAVLALADSVDDLRARLGRIVVGRQGAEGPTPGADVTAADLGAVDAMLALLQDALQPNLVTTREGTPAFVHGGPFANIAHGASSVVATRTALAHAQEVVTEAGFGFDLGGEKFLDVKMRQAGLWPRAVVLVATAKALREHGAGPDGDAASEDALTRGLPHLARHLDAVAHFGLPAVVALNVFPGDGEADLAAIEGFAAARGVPVARVTAFADGGAGAEALAARVLEVLDAGDAAPPTPRFAYPDAAPLTAKIEALATDLYGAADVAYDAAAAAELARLEAAGYGPLQVCMAKTHLSFADDPKAGGLAEGFTLRVREVRLSAGAGFVVVVAGRIVTMPALPREPAAKRVRVGADGRIRGLMQGD
ncbi:MAG: formate--tetrahydrofolate ligase [Trueperaceae bacterium]|nr:formate--tetrahydrofolate ligase [Trueperaceae bacterium]